jgi:hypothetical protein
LIPLAGEKAHSGHFDLSWQPAQIFSLSRIVGRYSNTYSIPLVIGTPSAHEIRRKVRDDSNDNSGVYAINVFTSFQNKKTFAGAGKCLRLMLVISLNQFTSS